MAETHSPLEVRGEGLTIQDVVAVTRNNRRVVIPPDAKQKIDASRHMLERWIAEEKIVYGVTTGFGPFVSTLIPPRYQTELQENLIRSHAANVGPFFSQEEVRAAMLLRLNALSKGYSAIRYEILNLLAEFLNRGIHPRVPQWGSVGASGDLNPSAHIALALMGEGEVEFEDGVHPARDVLNKVGLSPVVFQAKEGLALINGTTMMAGVGSLQVYDAWNAVRSAEVIGVLAMEMLGASGEPFHEKVHTLKPHPGQIESAANIRRLSHGSQLFVDNGRLKELQEILRDKMKIVDDVIETGIPVQNVYSIRATPQILGAVRDALTYITERLTTEMNSANDNPLFFVDMDMVNQGAHFHGQSVALPLDVLAISLTEIGVLSERRLNKMLDKDRSGGLSPFLARGKAGLRCGFEGAQYIPTSLVAECRTLCSPASIQSIPSNGENQDVVSMGLVAARKAREIKERIEYVLAVELLAACEAVEEKGKQKMGAASQAVYHLVRASVRAYDQDRYMTPDIEKVKMLVHGGQVVAVAEGALGESLQ